MSDIVWSDILWLFVPLVPLLWIALVLRLWVWVARRRASR